MSSQLPYSVYPCNCGSGGGGGGGSQDLQQVLTIGNNAGSLDILNVNNLSLSGTLSAGGSAGLPTQFLASNGGLPAFWSPVAAPTLEAVLLVNNSAQDLTILNIDQCYAYEFLARTPYSADLPNSSSAGIYGFIIKNGLYNANTGANVPYLPLINVGGYPTQNISLNANNKSLNFDTRIFSRPLAAGAPANIAVGATLPILNFGTQALIPGSDVVYYDPMNLRVNYNGAYWDGCGSPTPFRNPNDLCSWTITSYVSGMYAGANLNNLVYIQLEQYRSGVFYKLFVIQQIMSSVAFIEGQTACFVFTGLNDDDWQPNRDEWRGTIRNLGGNDFLCYKANISFEWKQLS